MKFKRPSYDLVIQFSEIPDNSLFQYNNKTYLKTGQSSAEMLVNEFNNLFLNSPPESFVGFVLCTVPGNDSNVCCVTERDHLSIPTKEKNMKRDMNVDCLACPDTFTMDQHTVNMERLFGACFHEDELEDSLEYVHKYGKYPPMVLMCKSISKEEDTTYWTDTVFSFNDIPESDEECPDGWIVVRIDGQEVKQYCPFCNAPLSAEDLYDVQACWCCKEKDLDLAIAILENYEDKEI